MFYVVSKNRISRNVKVFVCQNKHDAKETIETEWAEWHPVAIFQGAQLSFVISYADEGEVVIKRKAKVEIND